MGQTTAAPGITERLPLSEGQIVTGAIFNEPMRVETIRANMDSRTPGVISHMSTG
jgi:hypothetical protein